jgi:hypothetical protein
LYHALNGNRDQYGNYDYRALAEQWNGECIEQLRKPLAQRAKMYPKTAQLIRDFHKKVQQHRNQKKTLRQTVCVTGPSGVAETTIASRAVDNMRRHLQQQSANYRSARKPVVIPTFNILLVREDKMG